MLTTLLRVPLSAAVLLTAWLVLATTSVSAEEPTASGEPSAASESSSGDASNSTGESSANGEAEATGERATESEPAEPSEPSAEGAKPEPEDAEPKAEESEPEAEETAPKTEETEPQEMAKPAASAEPADRTEPAEVFPGQADLDKATEMKLALGDSRNLQQLNRIVKLLEVAGEKGLDEGNADFAQQMLIATLMQRASLISAVTLERPAPTDGRWQQMFRFMLSDLQRVVAMDDTVVEAHFLIGRLQSMSMGDRYAARRSLDKVIASESEELTIEQRAQAFAMRGATQTDPLKQQADFAEATKLLPGKAEFYLLLARSLQQQNKSDEALASLDKAAELAPENAAVFELKGMVLRSQEKVAEAIAAFDRASELAPQAVAPYQYRGELYSLQGDRAKAIEQLTKAIELAPANLASPLIRAQLYQADEQYDLALADIESVLSRQPALVRAHLMRSSILNAMGRRDEAMAKLEEIAQATTTQPQIQLQLAGLYMDAGESAKAIEALTLVIDQTEGNALAIRMRGDMYLSIGKHPEAVADFAKSFELKPDDSGLLNNYAWTLATSPFDEIRNGARAVELATKACELTDYNAAHILSTLAAAYAESGNFEKAIEWSQKAVDTHAADETKTRDMRDELAAELASYQAGRPWRELQQEGQPAPGQEPAEPEEEEAIVPLDF